MLPCAVVSKRPDRREEKRAAAGNVRRGKSPAERPRMNARHSLPAVHSQD